MVERHQKQNPDQGLPDRGPALPSEGSITEGDPADTGLPKQSMAPSASGKSRSRGPVAESKTPAAQLQRVRDVISGLVENPMTRTDQVLMLLRSNEDVIALRLKDPDLEKLVIEAKDCRDGKVRMIKRGNRMNTTPIPWLWKGFIRKGKSNLVYGDPKTGKTRLVLGMLGAYANKSTGFLGHEISQCEEDILIVGPDMCEDDWAANFVDFHLGKPNGEMHERIRGVIPQGRGFRLNEEGIQLIVDECRDAPGLVILLDSLFTLMSSLGLDENKPGFADPIAALVDAVAPYEATVIVIHHAKKGTEANSMAGAARGSSAITGFVDQLVHLRPFEDGGAKQEQQDVEVRTQGRRGKPAHVIAAFDNEAKCWMSRGKPSDVRKAAEAVKVGEDLPEMQLRVMTYVLKEAERGISSVSSREIARALHLDPVAHRARIKSYLDPLVDKKGYLERVSSTGKGPGRHAIQYSPTKSAKMWAALRPKIDIQETT